jgi:hypothetical protein
MAGLEGALILARATQSTGPFDALIADLSRLADGASAGTEH